MDFQRRHYEAIAKTLNAHWVKLQGNVYPHALDEFKATVADIARMFELDNERFRFHQFINAVYDH